MKTVGPLWRGFGMRVEREFWFENGDFVLRQTLEKVAGEQSGGRTAPALDLERRPSRVARRGVPASQSQYAYKSGFHPFGRLKKAAKIEVISPSLLQITPAPGAAYKIGADSPVAALVAVKDQTAWRIRAQKPQGEYPEGAAGAGFPVEFYNHSDPPPGHYIELELLSPLRGFIIGSRWTHTVRWSLHSLPPSTLESPETRVAVESLLSAP